jgi:tRNA (adenine37-N6)-methyltransferase
MNTFEVRPIGKVIKSPYKKRGDAPRQGRLEPEKEAEIEIFEEFLPGVGELSGISHIYVLLWFDRAERDTLKATPPHMGGEIRPVFCTRSPARPNPIGLDIAEVLSVDGGIIRVAGMDALEGTPVIDIKPYTRSIDCIPDASDMLSGKK